MPLFILNNIDRHAFNARSGAPFIASWRIRPNIVTARASGDQRLIVFVANLSK